jgi:hypothetical protein
MPPFEEVWNRIRDCSGQTFRQKRGKAFTYEWHEGYLVPSTTNQNLPKTQFEAAYQLLLFENTTPLQHLRGPSYIFAIITDPRIRGSDW